ncbi:THO complex subunit 1 transcription elongation factor-domain-containing protein [Lenzites betulinus]|nr:THO complex subunit 1 transcription elongation factor-domain-containing protein [Lenzites betulinus]
MEALQNSLTSLLASLPPRPIQKDALDALVTQVLAESSTKTNQDTWKNKWEYVLRNEAFDLASTEGKALKQRETKYYEYLSDRLDLILSFTEHDACDQIFPFNILQDLLETQTIASCSHIFSWIELRADRLTAGMIPQKGKALVLLRTLNDLLRRLSKMGATTMFCGRILTFLSRVFPLGERSGVNLRGEYGPVWEGPGSTGYVQKDENQMEVDETKEEPTKDTERKLKEKEDFHLAFWSLQLPFSRPSLFAEVQTFSAFKDAVTRVLPTIKEATAKERSLMGNKSHHVPAGPSAPLKRKREPAAAESTGYSEYYFAKYLTSPELLDLEIADTHFRRQFLFQLLILLNHLLNFTKAAKATWSTSRNRSLQIDFTLEAADAQWVQETITRAVEELRQTSPNGRAFAEAVQVMLEREKNWVRWKNELCPPFDREPWSEEVEVDGTIRKVGLEEATEDVRKKMRMDPEDWPHRYGSAPLTEIWEMGYRDLRDLEHPFQPGDVKDFVRKIKQEDARIDLRKKQLTQKAERMAQARARAAALKDGTPAPGLQAVMTTAPSNPPAQPAAAAAPSPEAQRQNASGGPTLLHPSLPAKPGSTPAPGESAAPSPARVSTPNPPPTAAAPTPVSAPLPTPTPAPAAAPTPEPAPIVLPPDDMIRKYEENKQRWSWLALRTTRDQYLQHFGRIGAGDIVLLAQEIERERVEREKAAAEKEKEAADAAIAQASASPAPPLASGGEEGGRGPEVEEADAADTGKPDTAQIAEMKDAQGDVKMEDR